MSSFLVYQKLPCTALLFYKLFFSLHKWPESIGHDGLEKPPQDLSNPPAPILSVNLYFKLGLTEVELHSYDGRQCHSLTLTLFLVHCLALDLNFAKVLTLWCAVFWISCTEWLSGVISLPRRCNFPSYTVDALIVGLYEGDTLELCGDFLHQHCLCCSCAALFCIVLSTKLLVIIVPSTVIYHLKSSDHRTESSMSFQPAKPEIDMTWNWLMWNC